MFAAPPGRYHLAEVWTAFKHTTMMVVIVSGGVPWLGVHQVRSQLAGGMDRRTFGRALWAALGRETTVEATPADEAILKQYGGYKPGSSKSKLVGVLDAAMALKRLGLLPVVMEGQFRLLDRRWRSPVHPVSQAGGSVQPPAAGRPTPQPSPAHQQHSSAIAQAVAHAEAHPASAAAMAAAAGDDRARVNIALGVQAAAQRPPRQQTAAQPPPIPPPASPPPHRIKKLPDMTFTAEQLQWHYGLPAALAGTEPLKSQMQVCRVVRWCRVYMMPCPPSCSCSSQQPWCAGCEGVPHR